MAKKFIQKAIKKKGALRAKAKTLGLIKGDEKLSASDIKTSISKGKKTGNTKLVREAILARTLSHLRRKAHGKKKKGS